MLLPNSPSGGIARGFNSPNVPFERGLNDSFDAATLNEGN